MKVFAPVQIGGLGKAFFIVLSALTLTWAAVSWLVFREIYVARPILIANLILAAILGWLYYRLRYHVRFAYDEEGFALRRGREAELRSPWSEYEQISLVHLGAGQMAVRLYRRTGEATEAEFVEIPASALGLDGFALRDELQALIRK